MEISELKIQNRIRFKNQIYLLAGVYSNENGEYYVKIRNSKQTLHVPANKIEPIQMDESWLVRFGFTKTYESSNLVRYESANEALKFDIDFRDTSGMGGLKLYGNNIKCAYVHQFQNLFCFLFGKDVV